MHPIIRFNYLCRDAGNYKSWGESYFSNPEKLDLESIDKRLRQAFVQEALFIAHQIDIPEVFLFSKENPNSDDHCYHEYDSVEFVENVNFEIDPRTIKQFIETIENAAVSGWSAFNPLDELANIYKRLSA